MELKRFVKRFFSVAIICLLSYIILLELFFQVAPREMAFEVFEQDWIEISQRIEASNGYIPEDTLFVGCSVAGQLLPFNESNQLTSTGATYPIGNYFLIKNAIEKNKNIQTVVYLSIPNVIGNRLSRERTYGYFVKPFFNFQNREEICASPKTMETLGLNSLLPLCVFNSFKVIRMDEFNYSNGGPRNINFLSEESFEWISKIDSLCGEKGVKLHLASPPVRASLEKESSDWYEMRTQVKGTALEALVYDYLDTVTYLEDSLLKDRLHWKDEYIDEHGEELVKSILSSL